MERSTVCVILILFQLLYSLSTNAYSCTSTTSGSVCYGATLSNSYFQCYGYLGCAYSELTSTGYIQCLSMRSCYGTLKSYFLTASTFVNCQGYQACYRMKITSGSYVTCGGYQGCVGHSNIATYTSASYQYAITAGTYIECQGYESCAYRSNITSESGGIKCIGYHSCNYIFRTGILAYTNISCSGYESCQNSKLLSANDGVYCEGTLSCAYSRISGIESITAYGHKSLNNANISSLFVVSSGTMTVNLYGWFAGNGLTVTCDPAHTCIINCAGNGCYGTELITTFGTFVVNCDESMNITCPNGYYGPTPIPTFMPVSDPSKSPTDKPTLFPSPYPTKPPTGEPTPDPTKNPTNNPTDSPTKAPTDSPTESPTRVPTDNPTPAPTLNPTPAPSDDENANSISTENNASNNTLDDVSTWIIIVLILIIFALIIIIVTLSTNNKHIKSQLQTTKEMLLSEQSEMLKALSKSHGAIGAASVASFSGMRTDSIIPQQPARHANLIQQWASTNGPQGYNYYQQQPIGSASPVSQVSPIIPGIGIQMGTLDARQRHNWQMANALNNGGKVNKIQANKNNLVGLNEGVGNGNGYGEFVLPEKINVKNVVDGEIVNDNKVELVGGDNSDDNVDVMYVNAQNSNMQTNLSSGM